MPAPEPKSGHVDSRQLQTETNTVRASEEPHHRHGRNPGNCSHRRGNGYVKLCVCTTKYENLEDSYQRENVASSRERSNIQYLERLFVLQWNTRIDCEVNAAGLDVTRYSIGGALEYAFDLSVRRWSFCFCMNLLDSFGIIIQHFPTNQI